jgi:hypothetical protein
MSLGKAAGLTAGFLGVFALGLALGPSIVPRAHTDVALTSPAETTPAPAAAEVPKPAPAARAPKAARPAPNKANDSTRSAEISAQHPELCERLKPVLNRGADMSKAAEGFRSGQEFATVAHAARNTQVPFMLLKHRVLNERMSLASAILASHPDTNAAAEVARARAEAKSDVDSLNL